MIHKFCRGIRRYKDIRKILKSVPIASASRTTRSPIATSHHVGICSTESTSCTEARYHPLRRPQHGAPP